MTIVICGFCGGSVEKDASAVNRANKAGLLLYCGRECAGKAHRKGKTIEQKKEEKRLYDLHYRATSPTLKGRKAIYYQRTKDPIKEAEKRKEKMPQHVEYCRRPEYKEWKRNYDRQHLARKQYGEFSEAVLALRDLENEVFDMIERTDVYAINGTLNKKQTRRREYERAYSNQP